MYTKGFNLFFRLRCLLVLGFVFFPVFGWAASSCTGAANTWTLTLPSQVAAARDLPNGSLLTNWVSSPATTNYWSCTLNVANDGVIFQFGTSGIVSGQATSYTATYNGVAIRVFPTNVAGVGVALASHYYQSFSAGCPAGWDSWATLGSTYTGCQQLAGGKQTASAGGQMAAALVKIGDITPGTLSGTVATYYNYPVNGGTSGGTQTFAISPVNVTSLTCTTPDVSVPMGTFRTTDFPNVGSLSPNPAGLTIQLLNCPGGTAVSGTQAGQIHGIQYRIDPTSGTLATNVAALTGSPSASGIGIQLFTSSASVFPLSTMQTLSGYNSTSGGNYSIPMTARYYRTGTVTAGPANTTMTLTVSYQ
ncbi:fimbrial protein [Paraburkholderia sp. J63]|uniref:fimbrial protein n=1 Tax=Paraburkholderia sp. J63 TaxID=2805434 RepID=UPI002ABDF05E|nr:fimbrial protein [Paraburkholderia sp. J63]